MCIRDRYWVCPRLVLFMILYGGVFWMMLAAVGGPPFKLLTLSRSVSYTHLDVYKRQRQLSRPMDAASVEVWVVECYLIRRTPVHSPVPRVCPQFRVYLAPHTRKTRTSRTFTDETGDLWQAHLYRWSKRDWYIAGSVRQGFKDIQSRD